MKNHVLLYHDHSSSLMQFTWCNSTVAIKEASEAQATGDKVQQHCIFSLPLAPTFLSGETEKTGMGRTWRRSRNSNMTGYSRQTMTKIMS